MPFMDSHQMLATKEQKCPILFTGEGEVNIMDA